MMTAGNSSIPNFKRNQPHPLAVSSNPTAPIKQTQSPPTNTAIYTFPPPKLLLTNTTRTAAYLLPNQISHRFFPPHELVTAQQAGRKTYAAVHPKISALLAFVSRAATAAERAGEEHNHANAYAGALVRDGCQAYDGAGALDAAVGLVEELAFLVCGGGFLGEWEISPCGSVINV